MRGGLRLRTGVVLTPRHGPNVSYRLQRHRQHLRFGPAIPRSRCEGEGWSITLPVTEMLECITHTATLLRDGRVFVAGGVSYGGIGIFNGSLVSTELYTPDVLVPGPTLVSVSGDGRGQGAIFHAGTTHVAAPEDPAAAGENLDIYCTGLSVDSAIRPQVAIGGRSAAVQVVSQAPGVAGVNQVRVRVPPGIEPGPAVPVRLTYVDRPSNEVTIAVR
jgi:hypothetical protein